MSTFSKYFDVIDNLYLSSFQYINALKRKGVNVSGMKYPFISTNRYMTRVSKDTLVKQCEVLCKLYQTGKSMNVAITFKCYALNMLVDYTGEPVSGDTDRPQYRYFGYISLEYNLKLDDLSDDTVNNVLDLCGLTSEKRRSTDVLPFNRAKQKIGNIFTLSETKFIPECLTVNFVITNHQGIDQKIDFFREFINSYRESVHDLYFKISMVTNRNYFSRGPRVFYGEECDFNKAKLKLVEISDLMTESSHRYSGVFPKENIWSWVSYPLTSTPAVFDPDQLKAFDMFSDDAVIEQLANVQSWARQFLSLIGITSHNMWRNRQTLVQLAEIVKSHKGGSIVTNRVPYYYMSTVKVLLDAYQIFERCETESSFVEEWENLMEAQPFCETNTDLSFLYQDPNNVSITFDLLIMFALTYSDEEVEVSFSAEDITCD